MLVLNVGLSELITTMLDTFLFTSSENGYKIIYSNSADERYKTMGKFKSTKKIIVNMSVFHDSFIKHWLLYLLVFCFCFESLLPFSLIVLDCVFVSSKSEPVDNF